MRRWTYLAGAIVTETCATLAMRASSDHAAWIVVVVAGYALAFAFLALVLRAGMAIGVAYGVWAACGVVATAVLAVPLFGDPLTWVMGLGFAVIVAGVLLIELGSHTPTASAADEAVPEAVR
ncbi:DMT family transporter [Micromonospora sp. NPDC048935]|uniref:DMT family transporter n=1 Tax=Micromonospora sp. NPDC048935 TaxID=3364262 RepID=UPI0037141B94